MQETAQAAQCTLLLKRIIALPAAAPTLFCSKSSAHLIQPSLSYLHFNTLYAARCFIEVAAQHIPPRELFSRTQRVTADLVIHPLKQLRKPLPLWDRTKFLLLLALLFGVLVWNEYLGRWLMSYLKEGTGIVMREGLEPWARSRSARA